MINSNKSVAKTRQVKAMIEQVTQCQDRRVPKTRNVNTAMLRRAECEWRMVANDADEKVST